MAKHSKVGRFAAMGLAGAVCSSTVLFWPASAAVPQSRTRPAQGQHPAPTGPQLCAMSVPSAPPTASTSSTATGRLAACAKSRPQSGRVVVSKPVVVIYGDSLTVEAEPAVEQLARSSSERVVFRAYGGTAMCDWTAQAARDKVALHPQKVVLAFTGNTASCVSSDFLAHGIPGAVGNYERALTRMRSIYSTESMVVVLAPAMNNLPSGWFPFNGSPALNAMYRQVGNELHISVDSAADNLLTPNHVFSRTRPLTPGGPPVVVRLGDGVHLTTAGAQLYGRALLEPAANA